MWIQPKAKLYASHYVHVPVGSEYLPIEAHVQTLVVCRVLEIQRTAVICTSVQESVNGSWLTMVPLIQNCSRFGLQVMLHWIQLSVHCCIVHTLYICICVMKSSQSKTLAIASKAIIWSKCHYAISIVGTKY